MEFNPGNFFPVWPEMVGVPIPGTDRKTNLKHALFYGIVSNFCERGTQRYCYASTEYFMKTLGVNEANVSRIRTDLVKLGWVEIEHGDRNKVTKVKTSKTSFVESDKTERVSFVENDKTGTPVLTPVGPKNINYQRNIPGKTRQVFDPCSEDFPCSSADASERPAAVAAGDTSLSHSASLPPAENEDEEGLHSGGSNPAKKVTGVVKNTTPFENVKPTNVKPRNPRERHVAILAKELLDLGGDVAKSPGPQMRAAVRARLNEGYTDADLRLLVKVGREDDFYFDKPVITMVSEKGAAALRAKMSRVRKRDEVRAKMTKQARNYV